MKLLKDTSWVVYLMTVKGQPGRHAVCSASEWSQMDAAKPGQHKLVQRIMGSEGDAERYARGMQPVPEKPSRKVKPPVVRLSDRLPVGHGCLTTPSIN